MEAIILAGGFGTRLRSVLPNTPKPMAPIAGRPFLEIVLTSLALKGVTHVILSLGYMADVIVKHFGHRFAGIEISYEIEISPLGTGGAVRNALNRARGDHSLILNGDTFLDVDLSGLEALWKNISEPIMVAREAPDTSRYGRLELSRGRITGFSEKGSGGPGLINAGCYVLPKEIIGEFPDRSSFSLEADFLALRVRRQPLAVFITTGQFIDIGVPEDYERAQMELRSYSIS